MKPGDKIIYAADLHIDTSHIPAQLGYVLIFPFPEEKKYMKEYANIKPSIYTFRDENQTMKQTLDEYKQCIHDLKGKTNVCFSLSNGRQLGYHLTFAELAKRLEVPSIDGIVFYVDRVLGNAKALQQNDSDAEENYLDEAALQNYYSKDEKQIDKSLNFNINFKLPASEYVITLVARGSSKLSVVIDELAKKVDYYFKIKIKNLKDVRYYLEPKNPKDVKILLKIEQTIQTTKGLVNWSNILMETSDKVIFKREIAHPEHRIIIFKENSRSDYIIERFEEIQCMSFHSLYTAKLASPDKKKDRSNMVCLKVMDILIRQNQNLSVLSPFYQGEQKTIINLVGRVVSQKMHFYKTMKDLNKLTAKGFKIQEYVHSSGNINEQREAFRTKLRKQIGERAQKADVEHFKDINHVEPIYIYTSEEIHHSEDNTANNSQPVYRIVNRFLREDSLLTKTQKEILEDWKYQYTSSLVGQLTIIPPQRCKVYRGVDYNPGVQKGDIITFKPFTSTSRNPKIAHFFFEKQHASLNHTLFTMTITSGKQISKFSAYQVEEQLLLEPYTQFRVKGVKEEKKKRSDKTITYREIELEQLSEKESSIEYPQSFDNIIIWIDKEQNQAAQAESIYKSIKIFQHPTLLVQFSSTKKFKEWLIQERTQALFKDDTSRIVLITNMRRQEEGVQNQSAGVDAIEEVQKMQSHREIPILLYVGYIKGTIEMLKKNASRIQNLEKIKVGNQPQDTMQFLSQNLEVSFNEDKGENPEVKSVSMKKIQSDQTSNHQKYLSNSKSSMQYLDKKECLIM